MAKLKPIYYYGNPEIFAYRFRCPGCGGYHNLCVSPPSESYVGAVWAFNGDLDKPTFSPSVLQRHGTPEIVCHSFVRDGQLQFLNDCSHHLAGKTVELPEVEA